jgi:hypothetical protein
MKNITSLCNSMHRRSRISDGILTLYDLRARFRGVTLAPLDRIWDLFPLSDGRRGGQKRIPDY